MTPNISATSKTVRGTAKEIVFILAEIDSQAFGKKIFLIKESYF